MVRKLKSWEAGRVVVFDNTVCSGCRTCETVCALAHEGVVNPRYARIEITRHVLDVELSDIALCAQCENARCAQACPKGAIKVDPATKAQVIDEALCIGCGNCAKACIMSPSRITVLKDRRRAIKCDLCGGEPKCVALCPMGALAFKGVE